MVNATRPSALPPPDIANLRLLKANTYDDLETGTWVSIFGEVEGLSQAWEAQRPVIEISLLDDAGQMLTTIEALVFRSTADEREETFTQGSFKAGTAWHTRLASLALRCVRGCVSNEAFGTHSYTPSFEVKAIRERALARERRGFPASAATTMPNDHECVFLEKKYQTIEFSTRQLFANDPPVVCSDTSGPSYSLCVGRQRGQRLIQESQARRDEWARVDKQEREYKHAQKRVECLDFMQQYRRGQYKPDVAPFWMEDKDPADVLQYTYASYRCKVLKDRSNCNVYYGYLPAVDDKNGEIDSLKRKINDLESEVYRLRSRTRE